MRKLLLLAVLALAVAVSGGPGTCEASPPSWSLTRASVVVTAQGAQIEGRSYFLPAVGLSYSLTSQLSLIGETSHEFPTEGTINRLGARLHAASFGTGGAVGLGVNWVSYQAPRLLAVSHEQSWTATIHAAFPVARWKNGATALWGVASAERDPQNELTTYRLGMRAQLLGGKP